MDCAFEFWILNILLLINIKEKKNAVCSQKNKKFHYLEREKGYFSFVNTDTDNERLIFLLHYLDLNNT